MSRDFWRAFMVGYSRANLWLSPVWVVTIAYLIWKNT